MNCSHDSQSSTRSLSQEKPPDGQSEDQPRDMPPAEMEDGSLGGVELELSVVEQRGTWSSWKEFFLSCLGYAVGLGNIWRFPYLVFRNGGGAFLVPYVLFMVLGGIPLVFIELSLGQYTSQGPTQVWKAAPLFKGVGIAMVLVSIMVSIYYNVVLAWSMFYFFASMRKKVPWLSCNNDWNTNACCADRHLVENCSVHLDWVPENSSCLVCRGDHDDITNVSRVSHVYTVNETTGDTAHIDLPNRTFFKTPADEYFHNYVLKLSSSPNDFGDIQWGLALCLLAAWIIVFFCLLRGIRSSGKVVYFTVLFPYVILLVLLGTSASLEGAREGVIFYLHPDWGKLAHSSVWKDAANQIIFTLGPCFGGLITLASYNRFEHNCYRDALMIPITNCLTSIFIGFVVFTTLGHMAYNSGLPIEQAVKSGVGFVFVIYPEALTKLSSTTSTTAMSILFFFMLIILGIDSQFVLVNTVTQALIDEFPQYLMRRKVLVLAIVCAILFLFGLPLTTQSGLYILQILDQYATAWPVLVIGFLECMVFGWIYGFTKFSSDVWAMIGKRPGRWWRLMWQFLTPAMILFVLLFSLVGYEDLQYRSYDLPEASNIVGWVIACTILAAIPLWAIYALITTKGNIIKRFKVLLSPAPEWGPKWDLPESNHTMPDYIRSEKEEGISNPTFFHKAHNFDECASIATSEGFKPSIHPDAQYGDQIDTGSIGWSEDENKERGNWSGRYDFLLSGLGYSVGIGNVWRFPYLVYKNGGGAFFFPYLLMLALVGLPLFFMELAFGQFASCGPLTIWKVSPIFKGVGYASILTLSFVSVYYNVINAWSVYYLFASMQADLPWSNCNNTWNTDNCRLRSEMRRVYNNCTDSDNTTSWSTTAGHSFIGTSSWENESNCVNVSENLSNLYNTPSSEYFFNSVLSRSSSIDEPGHLQWRLALCLLFCWICTFFALIKGVKSAGKVVYVTVSLPYIILFILLVRYATLDSEAYLDGLKYYVTPQWSKLGNAVVWGDAASQLFFSLGLSQGGLIALSSYNRFHYDCYRDAYIICLVDTVTSVFAGFVIFAILGVMAKESGVAVADVVESSFALAYVVYPEAVTKLPGSNWWSVLFFFMLFTLAIDSEFLMIESIMISLVDELPNYIAKRRVWLLLGFCVAMFLLGLPLVCEGGLYSLVLMDNYTAAWAPLVIGIMLCVALAWVYKVDNFSGAIKAMLGTEPNFWWKLMWKYITPALLLAILLFQWISYKSPTLDGYKYPDWAHGSALLLSFVPILAIPLVAGIQLIRSGRCSKQGLSKHFSPKLEWGPALDKHRKSIFIPGVVNVQEKMNQVALWVAEGQVFQTDSNKEVSLHSNNQDTLKMKQLNLDDNYDKLSMESHQGSASTKSESQSIQSGDRSGGSGKQAIECTLGEDMGESNVRSCEDALQNMPSTSHNEQEPRGQLMKKQMVQKTQDQNTHRKHDRRKDVQKREKNTKGFNVKFPDNPNIHDDIIYVKMSKSPVLTMDKSIQTIESYLQKNPDGHPTQPSNEYRISHVEPDSVTLSRL